MLLHSFDDDQKTTNVSGTSGGSGNELFKPFLRFVFTYIIFSRSRILFSKRKQLQKKEMMNQPYTLCIMGKAMSIDVDDVSFPFFELR